MGGFSALVHKAMTRADERLIRAIPEALATTDVVCSSVNVGTTKAGLNMDAVKLMGQVIKEDCAAHSGQRRRRAAPSWLCSANAVEDNPFMAGAFHGVGEARLRRSTSAFQRPRRGEGARWRSAGRAL